MEFGHTNFTYSSLLRLSFSQDFPEVFHTKTSKFQESKYPFSRTFQEYFHTKTSKFQESKHPFPGLANSSDCTYVHLEFMMTKNYSNMVPVPVFYILQVSIQLTLRICVLSLQRKKVISISLKNWPLNQEQRQKPY